MIACANLRIKCAAQQRLLVHPPCCGDHRPSYPAAAPSLPAERGVIDVEYLVSRDLHNSGFFAISDRYMRVSKTLPRVTSKTRPHPKCVPGMPRNRGTVAPAAPANPSGGPMPRVADVFFSCFLFLHYFSTPRCRKNSTLRSVEKYQHF